LAGLASAEYHIDEDSVDVLTEKIIHNCGYKSIHADHPDDILLCFNEIILIHKVVVQGWHNPWMQFCGPVVEYILEKALLVFPHLHSLDVADAVKFYDGLQKISMRYLLPLMPFDLVCLAFGFEGLYPPGLGTIKYAPISSAWMDVLPWILPQSSADVKSVIFSVSFESNDGFDLLWRILELSVPGFKSTNPIQVPIWSSATDILSFCQENLLYFRFQAKHNMFFSSRTQTNIFLRNILHSEYADIVTTLQSHVDAYHSEEDDGYLPSNLCINGTATAIHLNASARARDVGLGFPQVRRIQGDPCFDHHNYASSWMEEELPQCLVQGYSPWAFRVDQGHANDHGINGRRSFERGPQTSHGRRDNRDAWDSTRPTARDRLICPDQHRRTFLPGVQCDACKRIGHVALTCDMLAMALFLEKYITHSLSNNDWCKIESNWLCMWKDKLAQPQRSPTQVLKAYCTALDITTDHLDLAMDWKCWPVDTHGDFAATQGIDGISE
jgi:hypothetical protein